MKINSLEKKECISCWRVDGKGGEKGMAKDSTEGLWGQ